MRGESFTMSAPWGVEFNQNFLLSVKDYVFKGFSDDDLDWGIIGFWDLGGFQKLRDFAGLDSLEEGGEIVSSDFLLVVNVLVVFGSEVKNGW
jgi:hypothetical protein